MQYIPSAEFQLMYLGQWGKPLLQEVNSKICIDKHYKSKCTNNFIITGF